MKIVFISSLSVISAEEFGLIFRLIGFLTMIFSSLCKLPDQALENLSLWRWLFWLAGIFGYYKMERSSVTSVPLLQSGSVTSFMTSLFSSLGLKLNF
jgi:hypothetical protein